MKNKKGSLLIISGLLFVAAALLLTAYNLYDGIRAERQADEVSAQLAGYIQDGIGSLTGEGAGGTVKNAGNAGIEIPDYILNPDMDMPVQNIDGQDYIGILSIPSLDLELPVISEWSYPRLKIAPCRYSGSAYKGGFIIAAHNYRTHFGSLTHLNEGDGVIFTDMDGNRFVYKVEALETLMPTDIEGMESGGWDLTLFTCTWGGQSRLTVRCVREEE